MSYALSKYQDIHYKNDVKVTEAILARLVEMTIPEQKDLWLIDGEAGQVCVYHDPRFPEYVVEYVKGSDEDSVTTLYEKHPAFGDRSRLREMRIDVMKEIAAHFLSLPSVLTAYDAGRGRQVYLQELGTMQLLDLLAHISNNQLIAEVDEGGSKW